MDILLPEFRKFLLLLSKHKVNFILVEGMPWYFTGMWGSQDIYIFGYNRKMKTGISWFLDIPEHIDHLRFNDLYVLGLQTVSGISKKHFEIEAKGRFVNTFKNRCNYEQSKSNGTK